MEKTKSKIFWGITFGGPVLLGILMWLVYRTGNAVGIFPVAWMFLPAAAVMVGQIVAKKKDPSLPDLPKGFIITFIITAVLEVLCCTLSFFMNGDTVTLIGNVIFMVGSIVSLILLAVTKKEIKAAYGLSMKNIKTGIFAVLLFIVLLLCLNTVPDVISNLAEGKPVIPDDPEAVTQIIMSVVTIATLPVSLFMCFIPYFGEEYGWRYYLQPKLQSKFGKRLGVVILGIVWGLWHAPINMFFYSPETVVQGIAIQVIACIAFGIFFAWAYMKTGNIWVVTAIHFFNNNMAAAISGGDGSGNEYTWGTVAIVGALYLLAFALPVIFTGEFRKDKKEEIEAEAVQETA